MVGIQKIQTQRPKEGQGRGEEGKGYLLERKSVAACDVPGIIEPEFGLISFVPDYFRLRTFLLYSHLRIIVHRSFCHAAILRDSHAVHGSQYH
jgi:hypothetical protein